MNDDDKDLLNSEIEFCHTNMDEVENKSVFSKIAYCFHDNYWFIIVTITMVCVVWLENR